MFSWFLQSFEVTVGLEWYLAIGLYGFLCAVPCSALIPEKITVKILSAFPKIGSLLLPPPFPKDNLLCDVDNTFNIRR
jgi:hypothetical protein